MSRRFLKLLVTVAMFSASGARAVENNPGAWGVFSAIGRFGSENEASPLRYSFDAQHRAFDIGSGIAQSLVRPAIGLDLGRGVSAWFGYAYVHTRRATGERFDEHRPWQQINWTALTRPRAALGMRLRLEQRFLETGDDVGWVLRGQARYTHRLDSADRWQAVAFIEPFVALNNTDWGADPGLTQNRVFLGASYRITPAFSLEFGYLNQFLRLSGEDLMNHLAVAHFKFRP